MIGQILGHYRVVAMIGSGGMGEVYRAHDEQLDRDVALKVLPAGTLSNETARRQFHKEALALARLNHPNIETVYEFSSQDGVDFLAMELIPGRLLIDKLRTGALAESEVLRLATQLVEGLALAHDKGVVHRDLKPGNLMITPEGRLKILDFGLARLLNPAQDIDITQSVTSDAAALIGTLPYMAPEQLRGESVDARSDIYAVGVVLYEMATGQRPFPQTHGPTLMGAILHEAPPPPSSVNKHLTAGLERLILKTLEKEASRRYQSARELHAALEGVSAGLHIPVERGPIAKVVTFKAALFLVLLTFLIVVLRPGGLRSRWLEPAARGGNASDLPSSAIKPRRSVAVLGMRNLSGKRGEAWLSTALSEMLSTELAAGEQLRTVPGENVAQMKISLSLPDADSFGKETLTRIHNNLNTDCIVLGSYVPLGEDEIRLDVRLQDAVAGETLVAISEKGSEKRLDELVSRAGAVLRDRLGAGRISTAEATMVKASLPSNPDAARLYSEGLAKLRVFDALGARQLLEKAIIADPNHALTHAALATAWSALGYEGKAQIEAKKAVDLSRNLSREEILLVEGRYREATRDWEKTVEIYRALQGFFPDNLEYGLSLVKAQISAGKPNEALTTVEALRKLNAPAQDDPRIDLVEGLAAASLGDFKRGQVLDSRAAGKARTQGARLILARALHQEAVTLHRLGELKEATGRAREAKEIYNAAGDRGGASRALGMNGMILLAQGDVDNAIQTFRESLEIAREIGNKANEAAELTQLGNAFYFQGKTEDARKAFEESLVIQRLLNDKHGMAIGLNNIATVLYDEGDLASAARTFRQSLALSREVSDKDMVSSALENLANVLVDQGNLNMAERMYTDCLRIDKETGDKDSIGNLHYDLGEFFGKKGDFAQARRHYTEALTIRRELGDRTGIADTQVAQVALSLEEGQMESAVGPLEEALRVFHEEKYGSDELETRLVLARAFLAAGKTMEARKEIGLATELAAVIRKHSAHLSFAIVSSRVRAASGQTADHAEAVKTLERALSDATKYGFVGYQFETRLALGELEIKAGKNADGRARLSALEKEAASKGFLLIASKAAKLRRTPS
jgi:eukaryotic-like serine/threonine-protein kinase